MKRAATGGDAESEALGMIAGDVDTESGLTPPDEMSHPETGDEPADDGEDLGFGNEIEDDDND